MPSPFTAAPSRSTSPPIPTPCHTKISTVNQMTLNTCQHINEYVAHQKNTGMTGICGISTTPRQIRHHVRQHIFLFFCPCQQRSLSRDRLCTHMAQHMKQGKLLGCAVHMVDHEGYDTFTKIMGWKNPPPFNILASNKTHYRMLTYTFTSTRSQPCRISKQKPTTPAVSKLTKTCYEF